MNHDVCITLYTFSPAADAEGPRTIYALRTLEALARQLENPGGSLYLHIADDGSPCQGHMDRLLTLATSQPAWSEISVSSTFAGMRGYGASYNRATLLTHARAEYQLAMEDDWELMTHLDLSQLVNDLEAGLFGCIRLGYLGWTQPLRGELIRCPSGRPYLLFDPSSPERHVFSGHPRLETTAWQRKLGLWPEAFGLNAGAVEFEVCGRRESREGVAWPLDLNPVRGALFGHIGTVQARDDQR